MNLKEFLVFINGISAKDIVFIVLGRVDAEIRQKNVVYFEACKRKPYR